MIFIIFGARVGGKGTQSNRIINDFNLKQISTGDLLRNEIKLKTEIGKKVEPIISSGSLVSDDIVNVLIEKIILENKNFKGFIFDGYPRNLSDLNKHKFISYGKGAPSQVFNTDSFSYTQLTLTTILLE